MGWSVREEPSELAGHRQSRKRVLMTKFRSLIWDNSRRSKVNTHRDRHIHTGMNILYTSYTLKF